jgi:hypothetical protein
MRPAALSHEDRRPATSASLGNIIQQRYDLRVRCKIAYPELISVTAGGVVVRIAVGIEAAKTTKASTKATALETTAAETAAVHREPATSAMVYCEAAAGEMAHRKPVTSEAAAHGVTSEAAAHGVTSEAAAHGVTSEAAADGVTSEAAAHGVTSEAAAHGVTSAAKATAAMSAPAASMPASATKRHSAGGRHCHAESDSRCGRNQFPSHRSLSLLRIRPPQYRKCMAALPYERITN